MKLMTISEVTKAFNVTTRMLRYYDEIGLLPSIRQENYAYRVYDESALRRLSQIITLRKLRIPLKKIATIFSDTELSTLVELFQESLQEMDEELTALQRIRDILSLLIQRLNASAQTPIQFNLFDDAELVRVMQTLSLSKLNFKEACSMDDLTKATETLSALKHVRIIHLPPCSVASCHYFGESPEDHAAKMMSDFVKSTQLETIKPDLRLFGFNNPSPKANETYGYEFWVTIPEDFEVPEPLHKKHFPGGLYAVHAIKMGDFHEWQLLGKWVQNSQEYDYEAREPHGMDGCLEEHLNAYAYFSPQHKTEHFAQLDLMTPIKAIKA